MWGNQKALSSAGGIWGLCPGEGGAGRHRLREPGGHSPSGQSHGRVKYRGRGDFGGAGKVEQKSGAAGGPGGAYGQHGGEGTEVLWDHLPGAAVTGQGGGDHQEQTVWDPSQGVFWDRVKTLLCLARTDTNLPEPQR